MKKEILQTVNNLLRRALPCIMVVCAFLATSFPSAANDRPFSTGGSNPEIRYLGTVEDKLVFQVDLKSTSNTPLFVSIKDDEGVVLFTERVRENEFSRKFAFSKEEFYGQKLSFVIHDANNNTSQAFQVARSMRLVEDVVITKL